MLKRWTEAVGCSQVGKINLGFGKRFRILDINNVESRGMKIL